MRRCCGSCLGQQTATNGLYNVDYDDGDEDYTAEQIASLLVKPAANQSANAMVIEDENTTDCDLSDFYTNLFDQLVSFYLYSHRL